MRKWLIALVAVAVLGVGTPALAARTGRYLARQQALEHFLVNHPRLRQVVQNQKTRHVILGQVQYVSDNFISLTNSKGEWVVEVTSHTAIRYHGQKITLAQLKTGDHLIVLGAKSRTSRTLRAILIRQF